MRANFWTYFIVIIGVIVAIGVICVTIFEIKRLEVNHAQYVLDKNLKLEILRRQPLLEGSDSKWSKYKLIFKKLILDICPGFIAKLLGF